MTEIVLTGGYGSTPDQYLNIAKAVGDYRGQPTAGYGLREALGNLAKYAASIDRQEVITHSGGLLAVHEAARLYDARPSKVTAIALSMPSQVRSLVLRGALIGLHDPVEQEQFDQKINSDFARQELLEHPIFYAKTIRRLGHFASFDFLADLAQEGADVTAVLMSHDGLFDIEKIDTKRRQLVEKAGGKIVQIAGVHTSFTSSPAEVLRRIEAAELSDSYENAGQYQLPGDFLIKTVQGAVLRHLGRAPRATAA